MDTLSRRKANHTITEFLEDHQKWSGQNAALTLTLRERLESYAEVFARYDEDASGDIDMQELSKVLETIGRTATHLQLKSMIKDVDENQDGRLHFREFCNLMLISDGYLQDPIMPGGSIRRSPKKVTKQARGAGGKRLKKNMRVGALKKAKRGDLKLNMVFSHDKSELIVRVFEGRNLAVMDWNGYSDPYCKIYIEQVTSGTLSRNKKKTEIKRRNLNPKWQNEVFTFNFPGGRWAPGALAHVVVMDWDRVGRNDFMGAFAMKLDDIALGHASGPNSSGIWFKLLEEEEGNKLYVKSAGPPSKTSLNNRAPMKHANAPERSPAPMSQRKALNLNMFKLEKVLGKGSFGKVFLAQMKKNGKYYALKALQKMAVMELNDVPATISERRILSLGHECAGEPGSRFLTTCVASFQTDTHLFYVMNLVSGGDLMFMVMNKGPFPENAVQFYTAEISCGLWFLHGKSIIYRDLKLDNVMIDSTGHVKIADFGMCKENCPEGDFTETFCGTPDYIAPEIYKYEPYSFSVDWWALGVICFEMLSAECPIDGEDEDELAMNVKHGSIDFSPISSIAGKNLCKAFLTKDPLQRLGSAGGISSGKRAIQNHEFFKKIDWKKAVAGKLEPIFMPNHTTNPKDTSNFDEEFTSQAPVLTPQDQGKVGELKKELFKGFDFTASF